MNDMMMAIQPKSDQINADDLIGGDMVITITGVSINPSAEQKVSMQFAGSTKVFRPCKSMARVMVAAWGADANKYVGRSMALYRDPKVKWGGMEVGGIRIRAMSHIESDLNLMLTMTKQSRAPYRVAKMAVSAPKESIQPAALARAEAAKGKESFIAWYNSEAGKACRATGAISPIMTELQAIAAAADNAAQASNDDPFANAATATDPELNGAIEAEHASQFQGVLDSIRVRIADGMEPAELRELFAAEIDAAKASAPEIYARIETALRGALL